MNKKEILNFLEKNPEKFWKVKVFEELGFKRQKCKNCGKNFWSVIEKDFCNDGACINYKFLDLEKITKKTFEYFEVWEEIKKFFERKNHKILNRYPVVCRWFNLDFTIAGIVNFYRLTKGKLDFEFPENPSLVNQICLRFNDLENVGLNGRSYSCFGMINQQSLYYNGNGYWKDECIELDLEMLTKVLGINIESIDFIEDAWVGPAAFGACLEYHVLGLELGNAVFTEFEIKNGSFKEMDKKVIDMGAGWERFVWISNLTPTSYDSVFKSEMEFFTKNFNIEFNNEILRKFYKNSASINIEEIEDFDLEIKKILEKTKISEEDFKKFIEPVKNLYIVLDHSRCLFFALNDGAVLNNVGGGYNLRIVFRRIKEILEKMKWNLSFEELLKIFSKNYPEFSENKNFILKVIDVEEKRYGESKKRAVTIIDKLKKENREINEEEIIRLYDSEGIDPNVLKEAGIIKEVPKKFFLKVREFHEKRKQKKEEKILFDKEIQPTQKLFYENIFEFEAKVLKIFENSVILDKTAFFPRMGGQEPDKGFINNCKVIDVEKIGDLIIHKLENVNFKEGDIVKCFVDKKRRMLITKNHSATHVINYVCKKVLGKHAWQNSAFKDEDKARLDIIHFENIDEKTLEIIENEANKIVEASLPIKVEIMKRGEAEKKYGFTIYQGGAIDEDYLRIVHVGYDVEACSGTHNFLSNTREIGFIRIFRTKKVQDGVVRLEFVAGESCENYLIEKEKILKECCSLLNVSEENLVKSVEEIFNNWKRLKKILKS